MWKGFQKPKRLAAELESLTDKFGKFSAQPFERGWGTTVGNALRRALVELDRRRGHHRRENRRRAARIFFDPRRGGRCHGHHPEPETGSAEAQHRSGQDDLRERRKSRRRDLRDDRGRRRFRRARQEQSTSPPSAKAASCNSKCASRTAAATCRADRNFDEDLPIGYIPVDSVHSPVRKVNYCGGSRASRPDDRLRKADARSLDQRRDHAAGRHRPGLEADQGPHEHLHQLRGTARSARGSRSSPTTIRASSIWTAPSRNSSFPCAPTIA